MAKYLRPRRGKYTYANSQNIMLKRGEMFLCLSNNDDVGQGPGALYLGDGASSFSNYAHNGSTVTNTAQPLLIHPMIYKPIFANSNPSTSSWTVDAATAEINNIGNGTANVTLPNIIGNVKGALSKHANSINALNADKASKEYVDNAIDALPEPMVFKGSLGTGGTITTLPTASSANEGYTYKVITAGTYASQAAKVGDTFISDGSTWVLIPSGDEPTGTVTSVAAKGTGGITVSGSPITSSGTFTIGVNGSTVINNLTTGDSDAQRTDYIVAQYAGGGATTTTYHRRPLSKIFAALNNTDITSALGFVPYDSTNPEGYTNNIGTITGIKMNGASKGTSGVVDLGTVITAHQDISGKADKSDLGTAAYKNIAATGNASTAQVVMGNDTRLTDARPASDVSSWAKASTKPTYTKSEVGLGNVGNFKAVSTVANQGLTSTEQSNARANIGAGTSSFSGAYNDLTGKPTLGTAAAKNVASSGNASTAEVVMGNDTRLTDSRPASDVSSWAKASTKPTYTKSEVGLGNVGNFKAVSTEASQGLSATEQSNARANIGAGTSNFSGSYNDLTNKPTLGTAAAKNVPSSGNASTAQVVMGNDTRLSDSRPASDVSSWAKASTKPTYTAAEVGAIATTAKGANNGVAELDSTGKVPSSQLPSFVDDVLEYSSQSQFPTTGESGKIYIAQDTNKTYRWSGTAYIEISQSLALGETSSTAYRGDRGKIAYTHSQTTSGNPHNVTKSDVGLGNVGNFKAVSTVANQGLSTTEQSNARANIGAGTSNFSGAYNDLTGKPTLGTAAAKNVASSGNASTAQVVMGNDTRLSDSRPASDVSSWAKASTKPTYTAAEVGLGNVGNFKAVSTVADQGLTSTEQSNARANIGAGTSSFSGAYSDLTGKPTIPTVTDTYSATGTAATSGKAVAAALGTLDGSVSGSAGAGKTLTAFSQTDGKVSATFGNISITKSQVSDLGTIGTAAAKNVPSSGNASTAQVVMGNDTRLTDSRPASDVSSWAKAASKPAYTAAEVGLGNVGNFKAVSTEASQGLSTTEQSNARANIGAGTSNFSGAYNDLTGKPTIPTVTDTYSATGTAATSGKAVAAALGTLDGSVSGSAGAGKTLTAFSQTDGKVSATFGNISITKSQVSDLGTIGTAAAKNVPSSGNASTAEVVMGNDTRLSNARPASDVSSWAKAATKPTYTATEVGLGNVGNFKAVSTVADQGLTSTEQSNARANIGAGTSSFSGSYNDLTNKPSIPTVTDTYSSTGTAATSGKAVAAALGTLDGSVSGSAGAGKTLTAFSQTDGKVSATFGNISITKSQVSDLGTIGTAAAKNFTTSVTSGSSDLVTSGAVYTAINNLPEPMVYKGTLGTSGTITSLPTASSANEGYTYKVITAGTYDSQAAKVGDVFTSNGTSWVLFPSGDTDTDTWRSIKINGTQQLGSGISTGAVDFVNGTNTTVSFTASGSKIAINATDTTYPTMSQSEATTGTSTTPSVITAKVLNDTIVGKGYTTNIGTITGIKMNGASKGTSGVVDLGTVITAHQDISGKADKSNTVTNVAYDTTNKKFTKTINGTTSDVAKLATTTVTGVTSSTTTASKATAGTAVSVAKAGSSTTVASGSLGTATATQAANTVMWGISVTNKVLKFTFKPISTTSVVPAVSNGTITPYTFTDVTVPVKASSATTVATGFTTT